MNTEESTVDILLATYNGERFLPEQLRSIEGQTLRTWRLLARDDGSNDGTCAILEAFRRAHPERVQILESAGERLGPVGNFGRLLAASNAPYFSCCDQDDVWRPEKTRVLLDLAQKMEAGAGSHRPVLVHSDLTVVDRELREVAGSFWRYQKVAPDRCRWNQLVVQNVVTGCAALGNAALRRLAMPFPQGIIMHDWWLALLSALCGTIGWTNASTLAYRQHGNNQLGAKHWNLRYVFASVPRFFRRADLREAVASYSRQAGFALERCGARVDDEVRRGLSEFSRILERSYPERVALLRRHGVFKHGLARNIALLARI